MKGPGEAWLGRREREARGKCVVQLQDRGGKGAVQERAGLGGGRVAESREGEGEAQGREQVPSPAGKRSSTLSSAWETLTPLSVVWFQVRVHEALGDVTGTHVVGAGEGKGT